MKGFATQGIMVDIGIVSGTDKGFIVLPLINTDTPNDPIEICSVAAEKIIMDLFPLLQACLSEDAYIGALHIHGMVPGRLPYQDFFTPDAFPGTGGTGDPAPAQVAAMINFYGDPDDYSIGNRLRTARNFIFGMAETVLNNSIVSDALQTALESFGQKLIDGVGTAGEILLKRAMRAVKQVDGHADTDDEIPLAVLTKADDRVKTQKRRLKPDF